MKTPITSFLGALARDLEAAGLKVETRLRGRQAPYIGGPWIAWLDRAELLNHAWCYRYPTPDGLTVLRVNINGLKPITGERQPLTRSRSEEHCLAAPVTEITFLPAELAYVAASLAEAIAGQQPIPSYSWTLQAWEAYQAHLCRIRARRCKTAGSVPRRSVDFVYARLWSWRAQEAI